MTLFEQLERGLRALRGQRLTPAQREARLATFLYLHHHAAWDGWVQPEATGDPEFVSRLLRAARGARCFDDHWRAAQLRAHGLAADNGAVTLWVPRAKGAWSPARPRRRQRVRLSFPCTREGSMPGYLVLVSRAGTPARVPLAKLYLNLKPEGASRWVELLLHDATLRRVRFEAKLFNHPRSYGRRDTAMMYLAGRDLRPVVRVLRRFVRAHPGWVRDEQVPFTFALDRGLSVGASLAAEAREGISYGEARCRLVAGAVLRAVARGLPQERWTGELRRAFAKAGGDFDRPWRGVARISAALTTAGQRRPRGRPGSAARRR